MYDFMEFNRTRLENADIAFLFDCGLSSPSLWTKQKILNPSLYKKANSEVYIYSFEDIYNLRRKVKKYKSSLEITRKIISVFSVKGGAGKTTTNWQIILLLTLLGYKVLAIDLDPQYSLTRRMGFNPKDVDKTMFDVLIKNTPIKEVICKINHNLDMIKGNKYLLDLEKRISHLDRKLNRVKDVIDPIKKDYDFIIIDAHSGKTQVNSSIVYALDAVLIPATCDSYGYEGITDVIEFMEDILDTKLTHDELKEFVRIIPTSYKKQRKSQKRYLASFEIDFPDLTLNYIRDSYLINIASDAHVSIFNVKDKLLKIDDFENFDFEKESSLFVGLNRRHEDVVNFKVLVQQILTFLRSE